MKTATNDPAARDWYLVYCKPRQESVARENLTRQGFESYLPIMRDARRRQGRRVVLIAPMFPRYLFIHLNRQTDNWAPIRSTLGVVSIVRFGRSAARVPDDLVTLLRSREDMQGLQILPVEEYKPGSRVRITQGGFAGYEGIFQASGSRDRVTVLLDVLGRKALTRVNSASIEPA
ncbi:transcription/translation regulatory transformer protein RfaH [Sulfuricaulis sp.]|uniref:transcription/translation regulatory transformer protein RfaH n=1 Tax=Sulfuricaulis sp. TaxID=2003553 RepID=UPI0025D159F3|nr:transcription/translation regulatory transformer protein RfaH [Sulfuricaulis sp.]